MEDEGRYWPEHRWEWKVLLAYALERGAPMWERWLDRLTYHAVPHGKALRVLRRPLTHADRLRAPHLE